jgi:hypothetical protein
MTIGMASSGKIPKIMRIGDPLCGPPLPRWFPRFSMASTRIPVAILLSN